MNEWRMIIVNEYNYLIAVNILHNFFVLNITMPIASHFSDMSSKMSANSIASWTARPVVGVTNTEGF